MKDLEQRVYDLEYENRKLKAENKELNEELDYICGYKDNLRLLNKIMKLAGKTIYHEDNYKESYEKYWVPILKKQYFKYKLTKDKKAIEELENNVKNNWNLTRNEKVQIIKKIRGAK